MQQEEKEIAEVLNKCRNKLQEFPQLCELKPGDVKVRDFEGDAYVYWGIVAYLYVKEIDLSSYDRLVVSLADITENKFVCNYIAYILQKDYGISMVRLFIESSQYGKEQQVLPFVEDNLLFEKFVELEEMENFLAAIQKNEGQGFANLLLNYAKLICFMQKQENVFRSFMKDKKELYFDFMSYFCREVFQMDLEMGNRMLIQLLQEEQNRTARVAVNFLDIGIYYGCNVFEQYFDKIHKWMKNNQQLRIKLIAIYIVYLKMSETDDLQKDIIVELEKIPQGSVEEKISFLRAILSKEPLPEQLKNIFYNVLMCSFEKDREVLKLLLRNLSLQERLDDTVILQHIQQIYNANEYWSDDHDFFEQIISILHEVKNHQIVLVDYFIKCMFTRGTENFHFALGLYKNMIHSNKIGDILHERHVSITELNLILKGLLYHYYDAKNICDISYRLLQVIPDTMDAESYLAVCMDEVYENYGYTYYQLAKQWENTKGKWVRELTKRIFKKHQECTQNQKIAYNKPDLQPSMELENLLRKAKSAKNSKIRKDAIRQSLFASLFPSKAMKYGKRLAAMQYKGDEYSYLVMPYERIKTEREIAHVYVNDPVKWYWLSKAYLSEREKYCEVNN